MVDKRLLRGARSRQAVAGRAVDIASIDGLDRLSLGRLATDLGLSKSGIQTLFRTKENLQIAASEAARERFTEAVIAPATAAPAGLDRLRALIDRWIFYAELPLFAGGCFWAANLPVYDSRPGRVRDVLFGQHDAWLALLADQLRTARDAGELTGLDPAVGAFQIDAALMSANTGLRYGDSGAAEMARRGIARLLTPSEPSRSTRG